MTCLQGAARAIEELRSARAAGAQLALAGGAAPAREGREAPLEPAAPARGRARAPARRQPARPAERAGAWGAGVAGPPREGGGGLRGLKRALGREGPFRPPDPEREGSERSALFWRESGEVAPEPLSALGRGDPVTRAARARERGLLEEEGRRRLKGAARREAPQATTSQATSAGRSSFLARARRALGQRFAPKGSDKTSAATTRLARAEALGARAGERAAARALGFKQAARSPAAG